MEKEFNATNGVHVKMIVPIEVSEAEKQRKIGALYDALNTNTSIYYSSFRNFFDSITYFQFPVFRR